MRLILLPISTRRTLIYCQKLNVATNSQAGLVNKITQKAAKTWADWENKEKGWQKKVTEYGNKALQKIPYEEWSLKSIPPLSAKRKQEKLGERKVIDVMFPGTVFGKTEMTSVLEKLATERTGLHKSRLIYSIIGMPISAPFMLVPIIPNIPFFYLVYRAWSHWCAYSGSKHLQFLLEKNLIQPVDSQILNSIYANPLLAKAAWAKKRELDSKEPEDIMLLTDSDSRKISKSLDVPELAVELERAIWQVSTSLEAQKQKASEKESGIVKGKGEDNKPDEKGSGK